MGQQVTLYHHRMTHNQKSLHLKEILRHATTHPIRYRIYQLTRIQSQVFHILLCGIHLTHQTTSIKTKDDVLKRTKINVREKHVLMTQSKIAQILQLRNSQLRKIQSSLSSNWMRIHYSDVFISYPLWVRLKWLYHHLRKHTCCLWTIHK